MAFNTLIDFRYQQHLKAKTGMHGMGKNRAGGRGPDAVLKVPVGTQIFEEDNETLIADLTEVGQREVLPMGEVSVKTLGQKLMTDFVLPLEVMALLLTAAMLGAERPEGDQAAPAVPGDPAIWREYKQLATRYEPVVAGIAAGRDAAPIAMPPLTPAPEIRRRLAAKHLILSFHWTATGLTASLESHDRVRIWTVRQPAAITKEILEIVGGAEALAKG